MKKPVLWLLIMGLPFTAWGWSHAVGFSGFVLSDFGGGFQNKTTFMDRNITANMLMPHSAGGFSVFYDAKYLEASLGIAFGGENDYNLFVSSPIVDVKRLGGDFEFTALNIGLLGKYPFGRRRFLTSPLLGVEYTAMLAADFDGKKIERPGAWNQLWFKLGWDWEISFRKTAPSWFIRWGLLYGFRLPTKAEMDFAEDTKKQMEQSFRNIGNVPDITASYFPGHGLTAKMAFGYRFK